MIDPMPFATYSFVMSITPGPNNVMLTASGANFGFRKTIPHILGIVGGFSLVLFGVCAGLDVVFTRWPALQTVLRWAGAAYLVYLGWRILRSGEARAAESRKPLTALEAAGFQFLNPKAWMMTLTAAAMFLPRELGVLTASSYMVGIMAVTNLPCITVWALFGSSMRGFLAKPAGRLTFNIVLALALVVTGVAMVL
jgi:threonine/homoserine/homoserine lactone efflux protein